MSWDVGRHTDGDTDRTVYKQVGEAGRKDLGLLSLVIEVGNEVYDVLFDVGEHLVGELVHSRLCVTVSSGAVAVDVTEVTLTVDEGVTKGEVLSQTYH